MFNRVRDHISIAYNFKGFNLEEAYQRLDMLVGCLADCLNETKPDWLKLCEQAPAKILRKESFKGGKADDAEQPKKTSVIAAPPANRRELRSARAKERANKTPPLKNPRRSKKTVGKDGSKADGKKPKAAKVGGAKASGAKAGGRDAAEPSDTAPAPAAGGSPPTGQGAADGDSNLLAIPGAEPSPLPGSPVEGGRTSPTPSESGAASDTGSLKAYVPGAARVSGPPVWVKSERFGFIATSPLNCSTGIRPSVTTSMRMLCAMPKAERSSLAAALGVSAVPVQSDPESKKEMVYAVQITPIVHYALPPARILNILYHGVKELKRGEKASKPGRRGVRSTYVKPGGAGDAKPKTKHKDGPPARPSKGASPRGSTKDSSPRGSLRPPHSGGSKLSAGSRKSSGKSSASSSSGRRSPSPTKVAALKNRPPASSKPLNPRRSLPPIGKGSRKDAAGGKGKRASKKSAQTGK